MLGVAARADSKVKNKLKEAWAGLEMISSSQDELERAIPSSRADNTPVFRKDAMNAVKLLLDEYKSLRASNETLAQELRDAAMRDDIVPTLVELTGGGKTADLPAVFAEAHRIYEPFIQRITASLQRQQQLLANIRVRLLACSLGDASSECF